MTAGEILNRRRLCWSELELMSVAWQEHQLFCCIFSPGTKGLKTRDDSVVGDKHMKA